MSGRIGALEEVVRLLESARGDLAALEKPSFDEKRMEADLTTALSAAKSALGTAGRVEMEGTEPVP